MAEINAKDFYIDEPIVFSMFFGEIGWALQRWFGRLRYLKLNDYKDRKFVIMMNQNLHVFVNDFVAYTIDLPYEFYDLGLEGDCYEAVPPNSPPGSFTPPNIYSDLLEYARNFYNREKAIEIFPPRGCNMFMDSVPQVFTRYTSTEPIESDRPIIVVFPRSRVRAANRNVPEFVWKGLVDYLTDFFLVVLAGTPNGACLGDYESDNVVNLINYDEDDKTELTIQYLNSAVCSISSQSGGTHISQFCSCPTYCIGHEQKRHMRIENRLNTPCSFRTVTDYRAIDVETIVDDLSKFLKQLEKARQSNNPTEEDFDKVIGEEMYKMTQLIEGENE